jgi:hypothetical protein
MKRLSIAAALLAVCSVPAVAMPPLCEVTDDPCVVEHDVDIDTATIDLGGRALVVPSGRTITVRTMLEVTSAGSLTLAPNGRIVSPDDGQILLRVFGDVRLEPGSAIVVATQNRGTVDVSSGGSIVMRGAIRANSASRDGDGGGVFLAGARVEIAGDGLEAHGGNRFGGGGWITIDASGDVTVAAPVVGRGGAAGGATVDFFAEDDLAVGPAATIDTSGGGEGDGGVVSLTAVGDVVARGDIRTVGGGVGTAGGEVELDGTDLSIGGTIDVSGAGYEGLGGTVGVTAIGDVTLTARLVGLAHASTGIGATVDVFTEGAIRFDGSIDLGRGVAGLFFAEGRTVRMAGPIDVSGLFRAVGCTVEIAPGAALRVTGTETGDRPTLTAGRAMTIAGSLRTAVPAVLEWHETPPTIAPGAVVEPAPQLVQTGSSFCFGFCGDRFVDPGEECDGGPGGGDCCSATCTAEPAGTTCDDGRACTTGDVCDGAGACVAEPVVCDACERCDDVAGCITAPKLGCQQILEPGAGLLDLKDTSGVDTLTWRWRLGGDVPIAAFGDPTAATDYTMCVYRQDSELLLRLDAPHGARWRRSSRRGVRYADGTTRMSLLAGAHGASSLLVKARGAGLGLPALPLEGTVRVQLESSEGACWTSRFDAPSPDLPHRFKSRSN